MKKIETLNSPSVYKIMTVIMKQIVFTKKEIEEETKLSKNTVSNIIEKLVELNILVLDKTYSKYGYKYKEIYDVFVGNDYI